MQRGSRQRLLRYSEIIADCRGAFTFLEKIVIPMRTLYPNGLSIVRAACYPQKPHLDP